MFYRIYCMTFLHLFETTYTIPARGDPLHFSYWTQEYLNRNFPAWWVDRGGPFCLVTTIPNLPPLISFCEYSWNAFLCTRPSPSLLKTSYQNCWSSSTCPWQACNVWTRSPIHGSPLRCSILFKIDINSNSLHFD